MKRYAIFCGDDYYPSGGFDDYVNSYDTMEEALQFAVRLDYGDWWHIVDIDKSTIVEQGHNRSRKATTKVIYAKKLIK